jgi:2-phospho-L-lactate guanylyltransferase
VRVLVIPVKRLAAAKTRLGGELGSRRRDLALAFAVDTVTAALSTPGVHVLVVTDDEAARAAVVEAGADVVPDLPDAGLNAALVYAAGRARDQHPHVDVGALAADLPALRPAELAAAISAVGVDGGFVCDAAGDGTTLLLAAHDQPLRPRFGPGSAQAHRADGLLEIGAGLPSLRRDVDTAADLAAAARLGLGGRTAELLQGIPGPWSTTD